MAMHLSGSSGSSAAQAHRSAAHSLPQPGPHMQTGNTDCHEGSVACSAAAYVQSRWYGALHPGSSLSPLRFRQVALRGAPVLEIEVKVAGLSRQHSSIHGSEALPNIIIAADLQGTINAGLKMRQCCHSQALDRHRRGTDQHSS